MEESERAARIELATSGDRDALQQLIVEYHRPLRRMVEVKLDAAARRHISPEDVLQDAYAAANQAITSCRFNGPGPFYRWLETIVLRKLVDHQRAAARLPEGESRLILGPVDSRGFYVALSKLAAARSDSPSRELAREEAIAALISSLARLPDDQRNVIRLRYLEQKPVSEVAACLDKTAAAVNGLCRRGLRNLGEAMGSISRFLLRE